MDETLGRTHVPVVASAGPAKRASERSSRQSAFMFCRASALCTPSSACMRARCAFSAG